LAKANDVGQKRETPEQPKGREQSRVKPKRGVENAEKIKRDLALLSILLGKWW